MYLKSIKAHGFKSFADSIEINIEKGITGIVGPNGSGKSNIVDAVKWVLGEQSIKVLRGTKEMSDVIFSGSKTRDAMSRAYVSLTFDNSDRYLNTEFDTVEIKRVLYKNGENDYFINNNKVRLKDITDLFIDSGAGRESFNIISQGSVADIINSRPEDRRIIFESAAGVLKYKKRKEETNRKLDKVQDNLEKINLVINELEETVIPLKKQAQDAKVFLSYKDELKKLEVFVIAEDITKINEEYTKVKQQVQRLNEEMLLEDTKNNESLAKLEHLKLDNLKLDEKLAKFNENLIRLTSELSMLSSKRQLTIERKKYEVDSNLIDSNILALKEEELTIHKNIETLKKEISLLKSKLSSKEEEYQKFVKTYQMHSLDKVKYNENLDSLNKERLNVLNQIEILESNIDNDVALPNAIRAILNNVRLKGIHNTVAKLLQVEDKFACAIDTALGYSANILVVDNENSAKDAINYLKDNKLGRATFFPLNIIKAKTIDPEILNQIKDFNGLIGTASSLVTYDNKYANIIENQLGNILVVDSLDALNKLGKLIKYRYRIVSLDGELLHTGGALSGGMTKFSSNSVIIQKEKLGKLKKQKVELEEKILIATSNLNKCNSQSDYYDEKLNELNIELNDVKETINRKMITLKDLEDDYERKHNELEGSQNVKNNTLDQELDDLLEKYYQKTSEKEILEKELSKLKNDKNELFLSINDLEKQKSEKNSIYNKKQQQLKDAEILLGKLDVRLDNLLNTLNESYNMTYEKAFNDYKLEIDLSIAKEKIINLKKAMKPLENVNIGAIEEFERLNTRYTFLKDQQMDLENSISSLQNAIMEMDEIMKEKFLDTFNKISAEFSIVYKKLFKGGDAHLKLTDPDDLLQTGVDIIASPPGKKLNSIGLLSGGEKTFTAIALLFAILNVKPVPFVILDEVEAALDEANVATFGKYLCEKKDASQFIIITHKKQTMEYADVLYGITMQESGVSKLVSVKLENL